MRDLKQELRHTSMPHSRPTKQYGPHCPVTVHRASMIHRWDQLSFLHWSYDPEAIQRLLPNGLLVDTFNDRAWVGLVPFLMEVRPPRGPAAPWLSHFCETNIRTYVTAPDGTSGVWFLSLDAARLAAVIAARTTYKMPYFWSNMNIEWEDNIVTYASTRRWLGRQQATSIAKIRVGDPFAPEDLGDLDHFITARWRLYSKKRHGLRYALAEHVAWPLQRCDVLECNDELVTAAGLPTPVGEPIAHWSPGVEVRIGFPHDLQRINQP